MKKAFSILMMAGLFLFFGCNDITEENTIAESEEAAPALTTWLHIAEPTLSGAERTALPEFDSDSIKDFAFSLSGAVTGAAAEETLGTYENLTKLSSAVLACSEGTWNFTLTASKDGTVFKGTLSGVEITSGENTLNFALAWDRTALEGTGSLVFTLAYGRAANADDVKLVTAELVSYDVATQNETALTAYAETALTPANNSATYEIKELAAGNYRVKINLYADTEKKNLINTWRELAIITGGQQSIAKRTFTSLNKVYTITYELADGAFNETTDVPTIFTRNTPTFTLPTPEKEANRFSGWFTDATFANPVTELENGSTGNRKFFAKWSKAAIIVTLSETKDLKVTSDVKDASVVFTVTEGTAPYTWCVDGDEQDATGDTFTFVVPSLDEGVYLVEVINGDLSTAMTVTVNSSVLYVSANGDDKNDGVTTKSAVATIAKATELMNDSSVDYTIYVDGMLGRSLDNSTVAFGQFIAEVKAEEYTTETGSQSWKYVYKEPIQAKSITLSGLNPLENGNPVDGINPNFGADTNGKSSPVLLVATSVPVTLKNIKLAGGSMKRGEALMVGGSYVKNDESVDIPANVTIKDGVLIAENNNGLSGPYWNSVVSIGSGSVCKMEGGSITDNYSGLGVVSVQKDAIFEMTGGSITGNHLYTDNPSNSLTCGVSVAAPAEDASLAGGTFKISGDAVVDEIYLKTGAVVTVAGALSTTSIQIAPSAYVDGTQLIEVTSDSGVKLSDAKYKFTLKLPSDGSYWQILEDGTLLEGYITTSSELGTLLSGFAKNSSDTPYKVTLTDSTTNLATIVSNVNSALEENGTYISLAFKNPSFTKIEGEFSEFVTCLTIPANVTSVGFIDGAGIERFKVASGNEYFAVSGTVLCSKDLSKLYRWPPATTSTSALIPLNVTSIADGAFANCLSIAEFSVVEGNKSFKVTSGGTLSARTYDVKAYQVADYCNYDSSISTTAPEFFITVDGKSQINPDYTAWANSITAQYVPQGSVTVGGLLTSYDETTLIACPPALTLYTDDDIKGLCGGYEKFQNDETIAYGASTRLYLYFDNVKPYAFCGVKNVQSITLGVEATSVPAYTFKDCSGTKYVTLSHKGTTIGAYTFCDCTALEEVAFSTTSITTVKSNALYGCTGLKKLYFEAGETTGQSGTASDAYPSTCNVTIYGKVN